MTNEQKHAVQQVIATLKLSGLNPSSADIKDLEAIATGDKTANQVIAELDEKYMQ